jgi:hypothetical protein
MKLFDEYKNILDELMSMISKHSPHEISSNSLLTQIKSDLSVIKEDNPLFILQRAKLHSLNPEQISKLLRTGTITTQEVMAHIEPHIDLFAGIGGYTKGVHNTITPNGKMIKVFLGVDSDSERGRTFQRNNNFVPWNKFELGGDIAIATKMLE